MSERLTREQIEDWAIGAPVTHGRRALADTALSLMDENERLRAALVACSRTDVYVGHIARAALADTEEGTET